jgi:hypothetical protein
MSLLRARRERGAAGRRRPPPSPWRLALVLAGVIALIWYLSNLS